jgi:hypothetical protein
MKQHVDVLPCHLKANDVLVSPFGTYDRPILRVTVGKKYVRAYTGVRNLIADVENMLSPILSPEAQPMKKQKKLTPAQAEALRHYARGMGAGESWSHYDGGGSAHLAWANHERMLTSLEHRGLIASGEITDAGRAELAKIEGLKP